jgi:hypothetical protein
MGNVVNSQANGVKVVFNEQKQIDERPEVAQQFQAEQRLLVTALTRERQSTERREDIRDWMKADVRSPRGR